MSNYSRPRRLNHPALVFPFASNWRLFSVLLQDQVPAWHEKVIGLPGWRSFQDGAGLPDIRAIKHQLATGLKILILKVTSITEIKNMTVLERLTAMEHIWDSLCHEEIEPESPAWHETVLTERKKMMDSPDAKFLTIEQLRERYR